MKIAFIIMSLIFTFLGLTLMIKACFFDTEVREMIAHVCIGCMDLFAASAWTRAADKYED